LLETSAVVEALFSKRSFSDSGLPNPLFGNKVR
jgi:hypothetical protein